MPTFNNQEISQTLYDRAIRRLEGRSRKIIKRYTEHDYYELIKDGEHLFGNHELSYGESDNWCTTPLSIEGLETLL